MVTLRLADALPAEVVRALGDDPTRRRDRLWRERLHAYLDAGHGACCLRLPAVAAVMERSLLHFDGERYRLLAWSVMPSHVHAVLEAVTGFSLSRVLHSWKSYTAKEGNRLVGRTGRFWQPEYFDRYIRDGVHYANAVSYVEANMSEYSSAARGRP